MIWTYLKQFGWQFFNQHYSCWPWKVGGPGPWMSLVRKAPQSWMMFNPICFEYGAPLLMAFIIQIYNGFYMVLLVIIQKKWVLSSHNNPVISSASHLWSFNWSWSNMKQQKTGRFMPNQGERQLTKLRIRITCNQRTWWDESAIVCTRTWRIWDFAPRGGLWGYAAEQKAQSSYYKLMISYDKTLEIWDIRSAEGLGMEQNLLHHFFGEEHTSCFGIHPDIPWIWNCFDP